MLESRDFSILLGHVSNEKAFRLSGYGQFVFKVRKEAAKTQIKKVVESLFDVKVKCVRTLRQRGKNKNFKGFRGQRKETKKAIVCLEEGYTIDLTGL